MRDHAAPVRDPASLLSDPASLLSDPAPLVRDPRALHPDPWSPLRNSWVPHPARAGVGSAAMTLPPDSDGALADPPVKARYRELLVAQYERLTFRGISRTGKAISLRLEDV